jgi:hypothetical protein
MRYPRAGISGVPLAAGATVASASLLFVDAGINEPLVLSMAA